MPRIQRDVEATHLDTTTGEELEKTTIPTGTKYRLKWFQQFIDDVSPERLGLIRRSLILVRRGLKTHKYLVVEEKPNPENDWMDPPT